MKTYTKIENIYERDPKTNLLIEGLFNSESVEYLSNCPWYGTEKIDGTNIGIVWDGYRVSFQGRTEKAQIPTHLLEELERLFGGADNEEKFESLFGEKQFVLFGEGYGHKIQKSGDLYLGDDVSFILFDVYSVSSETWLKRDDVENIAFMLGVDVVPVVFEGTLSDAVEYVRLHPMSTIGKAPMEGIVCKPKVELLDRNGKRIIVKIKARDW